MMGSVVMASLDIKGSGLAKSGELGGSGASGAGSSGSSRLRAGGSGPGAFVTGAGVEFRKRSIPVTRPRPWGKGHRLFLRRQVSLIW